METEQEEIPLSEEERRAIRSRLLDRGIFKLYEIGEKMDEGKRQSYLEDERVVGKFSEGRGYFPSYG